MLSYQPVSNAFRVMVGPVSLSAMLTVALEEGVKVLWLAAADPVVVPNPPCKYPDPVSTVSVAVSGPSTRVSSITVRFTSAVAEPAANVTVAGMAV